MMMIWYPCIIVTARMSAALMAAAGTSSRGRVLMVSDISAIRVQSSSEILLRLISAMEMPVSADICRSKSLSSDVSRLKKPTRYFCAQCQAHCSAQALLPELGRPPMMIKSPGSAKSRSSSSRTGQLR